MNQRRKACHWEIQFEWTSWVDRWYVAVVSSSTTGSGGPAVGRRVRETMSRQSQWLSFFHTTWPQPPLLFFYHGICLCEPLSYYCTVVSDFTLCWGGCKRGFIAIWSTTTKWTKSRIFCTNERACWPLTFSALSVVCVDIRLQFLPPAATWALPRPARSRPTLRRWQKASICAVFGYNNIY